MPLPAAPTQLRAQGIDALKGQRFDAAVELLNRYLDAAPNDAEAELALAAARSGQGKHVAALTIFERHLENQPRSPSLHFNRATTLERLGRKDDAAKAYKLVLQLKPDHTKSQQRLQTLGGIARPLAARKDNTDDIPMVMAIDDNEAEETPKAARRRAAKGRRIHPGVFVGLIVYVLAVIVFAFVAMPAGSAGGYAGAAVLSSLLFLGGLQTVHRSRHGLSRIPAGIGYGLVVIGALGLANEGAMDVYYLVTGPKPAVRSPVVSPQPAAGNARAGQEQPSRGGTRGNIGKNPGLIDTAIKAIHSGDDSQITAGCLALADNYVDDRKSEVIPLLEGLLNNTRIPVRTNACRALGMWGTTESIAKLEALASDRSGLVRSAAGKAIEKIKQRK
jgi:hypothetical protein